MKGSVPFTIVFPALFSGGGGVATAEKGFFIRIQNTIVSSKALVFRNCFKVFVHDYRHKRTNVYLEFLGFIDCF